MIATFFRHPLTLWAAVLPVLEGIAVHLIETILCFVLTRLAIVVAERIVRHSLHARAMRLGDRRRDTLYSLFENVIRYTFYFIFVLIALSTFGVHIVALLAGAGIVGLALAFGAQGLIKDVLTGLFILFEDQYGVGDSVQINGFTGTVTTIGLRLTRIRAATGEVAAIPNGQITQVINYSSYNSVAIIDVSIHYEADVDQACSLLSHVVEDMRGTTPAMVGAVNVLGVQSIQGTAVLLRVTAECQPNAAAAVVREAQRRIKAAFAQAGIKVS